MIPKLASILLLPVLSIFRPHSQNEHWSYLLYLKTVFPNYSLTLVLYFNFNSFSHFFFHFQLSCLIFVGCGSGLSGETLSEEGHHWIGLDISPSMLNIALEREVEGDLLLSDMGQGLGLRPGVIDGAISISAVQWLCNADRSSHNPRLRLKAFFTSLYRCLANGAKAVFQVYPENVDQRELILNAAMHAGFSGGIVVDFPHSSKKRKEFLVLGCGQLSTKASLSKGKIEDEEKLSDEESEDEENQTVRLSDRHRPVKKQRKNNKSGKGKEWILRKKDQMRRRGNDVPLDTKYTGRKRKGRF
ncbi:S-adenosyl-L-methionine-dependent methyltransferase [Medicago truncatula]|uniref:S-adenosyl-L-methionine-dependent methyltransferase n=1 Tax=Medicago truncatula TaxID=3880 RepID=A0A072UT75_MEDTR|nr:S-adenosyl-L-methionine-dependent methyltransferase [Medicago truncatula]